MARRLLRILPYKGNRDYQYYLDGPKVNGKRRRLFFHKRNGLIRSRSAGNLVGDFLIGARPVPDRHERERLNVTSRLSATGAASLSHSAQPVLKPNPTLSL
jgi:hypothetical protein